MTNKKRLEIAQQSESNNVRTLAVIQSEIDNKYETCDIGESYWALCKEYNALSGRKDYFESPDEKHKNENDENDEKNKCYM
jgi:hypothetical protein